MAPLHRSAARGGRRSKKADPGPDLFSQALDSAVHTVLAKEVGGDEDGTPVSLIAPPSLPEAHVREMPPHTAPAESASPAQLTARMLNEFVYCPRLFYYEHVEGIFLHNADTLRGKGIHKRVDSGTGAMPAADLGIADGDPAMIHSRSVSLGSDRLGVSAKLDLVESATPDLQVSDAPDAPPASNRRSVCPVDYKAGSPRTGEDGIELWPADKMQLGLQMLLLRDNGYDCRQGIIYYRGTKQRVPIDWTPDLEAWILAQIAAARLAESGPIPPPLVDSPKCVRCSLNPVCLPDETGMLQRSQTPNLHAQTPSPRRLIASRDEARALYLNTPGLHVGCKSEILVVKDGKVTLEEVRINDLTQVSLFGNIQISTQAIQVLCEKEIPVCYFSMGGWFYGITRGHQLKNVFTRIQQFRTASEPAACLQLARLFVNGKIRNHRTMLMRLHRQPPAPVVLRLKRLAADALEANSLSELLGIEGAAAAFYFGEFNGLIKAADDLDFGDGAAPVPAFTFDFNGRNRRPPTDPVNAMLSLAYSLLAKDCMLAALAVGLDPYIGFYHQPRFGRPALALDLMEEFRPILAESAVLTCINNGMVQPHHFVRAGEAVNLTADGRKIFFQCYEQRMCSLITHPVFEYKVSYRRVLELQFRLLAKFLTAEIPHYQPLVTR